MSDEENFEPRKKRGRPAISDEEDTEPRKKRGRSAVRDEEDSVPRKKRGRPANINPDNILTVLKQYKGRLCLNDDGQKLVSKNDNVWVDIARKLKNIKSPAALYSYVSCNKNAVREKIWKDFIPRCAVIDELNESMHEELMANSTLESTIDNETTFSFTIHVPGTDFDKLVETRSVQNKKRKKLVEVKKFRKDLWQDFVTQKIWNNTRLKCGYNFKYHYLNKDVTSGHFVGACNCGSKIECDIERNEDNVVAIACSTTKGTEECGKRYVRGAIRRDLGEKLQSKSAHVFRAALADELMDEEDPEPAHLPKTGTLRQVKHQVAKENWLDPDPIIALEILSEYNMEGEIPWIGHKPFFVHYSTKLQRNIYTKVRKEEHLCLAIDSTGSIIKPISRKNKKKSGPIFLYLAVISTSSGQLSVAQMLTERHTTGAINFWLSQWIEQWGLSPPAEIVCDQSVALLSAAVREFTSHKTINEYADAFLKSQLPPCYIRIDIAHYIKTWSDFLKNLRIEVAKFLKAGVGKIILSRNIDDARKIISALLITTYSPKCGLTVEGSISVCEKAKTFLKRLLETAQMDEFMDQFDDPNCSQNDEIGNTIETRASGRAELSLWRNWATEIADSVKEEIECAPGTEINAHWAPHFADRLVKEVKWLPLWSCVFRDKFGFGRCPASSAHVEAEFKTIKGQMLAEFTPPLRVDEFVQLHKKYLDGNLKIINAAVNKKAGTEHNQSETDCSELQEEDETSRHDSEGDTNNVPESEYERPSSTREEISTCPACKNGDMPSGAHHCMICKRAIHAIEPCSVPASDSDEGFGQKRICASCFSQPNARRLIESRVHENYRGQISDKKKRLAGGACVQKKKQPRAKVVPKKKTETRGKNSPESVDVGLNSCSDFGESATDVVHVEVHQSETPAYDDNMNRIAESCDAHPSSMIDEHSSCPACKNGDIPTGAHHCMICKRAIHAIEPCSVPASDSDEGFGQKRICASCFSQPNVRQLIESRVHENYRGQISDKKKRLARGACVQKKKQPRPKAVPKKKTETRGKNLPESIDVGLNSSSDFGESATEVVHVEVHQSETPANDENMNRIAESCDAHPSSMIDEHSSCPACKNGDIPTGAHNCMICKRAIHAIEPCSVPASDSDEGFGQKRICASCFSQPNACRLIESHAHENWRGQISAHEKKLARGSYVQTKKQLPGKTLLKKKEKTRGKRSPEDVSIVLNSSSEVGKSTTDVVEVKVYQSETPAYDDDTNRITECCDAHPSSAVDKHSNCPARKNDNVSTGAQHCMFYQLLETSDTANSTLMHRHATVFAPTNRAFQNFKHNEEELRDLLVLYHLSNLPQTIDQLGTTVTSELEGNPPLWVTRKRDNSHEEVYINNAKIIEGSSFKATMKLQSKYAVERTQVLHKIDEVLEPVITRRTAPVSVYNPNAYALMQQSDNIDLGKDPAQPNITLNLRAFRQQVTRHRKEDVFKTEGRFTFFMPVDHGFQPDSRPDKVDGHVIDGHVIPGHVLFTTPTPKNTPYNTLAFTDNIKVTISFVIRQDKMYVESNTLAGPPEYTTGVVPAEIIKANIPVKNGVVHLINRPLMVVDTTVRQFIESFKEKQDGPVYMFYDKIKNYGGNFMETLTSYQGAQGITLFAPSNAAWEAEGVSYILQDQKKFREILNLHYVKQKLPLDDIKAKSINQVKTAAEWKSLYFNVISGSNGSQTVTVEGGGVNATIITADIAATNGIIHIIDRVLGVPYTTVLDKLRTDPMLKVTYNLGMQRNFNDQLNDTRKRFTYFVPRDSAWENGRRINPSIYTKLFMPRYNYHTKSILERHLIVANEGYTMSKLKAMAVNGTLTIPAQRDVLKLRIREHENSEKYDENEIRPGDHYGYQIEWNGKWIRVFRPDVPCTNGMIHVIDEVLVSPGDVVVPGPDFETGGASIISLAPHLLMIVLAKWFL